MMFLIQLPFTHHRIVVLLKVISLKFVNFCAKAIVFFVEIWYNYN